MMLLAGTVPVQDMPLTAGEVRFDGDCTRVGDHAIPSTQGTGAMISAALAVTNCLRLPPPWALVAGDIGRGAGSREMYNYLINGILEISPRVLALHYCVPDMALMRSLCQAVDKCDRRPVMIADAGSMYAAKAAGLAPKFDIMTPDTSEMAFLADPEATHPAYIARHLFDTESARIPELVTAAYKNNNAARYLLVKGSTDYIACEGKIVSTITGPNIPALEPIGGTGDTLTGLVAALTYYRMDPEGALVTAARANRIAGEAAGATPATLVNSIIEKFPVVLTRYLKLRPAHDN
ncbi:MAG: NAD(P)H-hydrate dehydratase [Chloroflexota bacterium]